MKKDMFLKILIDAEIKNKFSNLNKFQRFQECVYSDCFKKNVRKELLLLNECTESNIDIDKYTLDKILEKGVFGNTLKNTFNKLVIEIKNALNTYETLRLNNINKNYDSKEIKNIKKRIFSFALFLVILNSTILYSLLLSFKLIFKSTISLELSILFFIFIIISSFVLIKMYFLNDLNKFIGYKDNQYTFKLSYFYKNIILNDMLSTKECEYSFLFNLFIFIYPISFVIEFILVLIFLIIKNINIESILDISNKIQIIILENPLLILIILNIIFMICYFTYYKKHEEINNE